MTCTDKPEDVLRFIARFTDDGKKTQVLDTFLNGCCWWFAVVLHCRFPGSTIYYSQVQNHFAVRIGAVLYDIQGTVPWNGYELWSDLEDSALRARIARDCILF